jgi:hypothetical protein
MVGEAGTVGVSGEFTQAFTFSDAPSHFDIPTEIWLKFVSSI